VIPDRNCALKILNKAGCSEQVIQHCIKVAEYAGNIAEQIKDNGYCIDVELVIIGALLHDIGRSRTHDIHHGIEGALLGEKYGFDERLIRIIKTHIGAGITTINARALGLPPGNYMPVSLEEKVVAHADNLVEDTIVVPITTKVEILKKKKRDKKIIRNIVMLNDEIESMLH
jgi:uncharacterized protein